MAMPATEDLRELERLLLVAQETGETMGVARLSDELGVGHNDLLEMLGTLREVGKAHEETPGEWIRGYGVVPDDGAPEGGRVEVSGGDPGEVDGPPARGVEVDAVGQAFGGEFFAVPAAAQVRLTRAMVDALEPAALGALIAAGVSGVADGEVFRFEVTP